MKLRLFILLLSFSSLAETDNFDMSLNGDFIKDYCSITTDVSYNPNSIDINSTEDEESQLNGITVQMVSSVLSCSDGTYNITVASDLPSDFSIPDKNQSFELQLMSGYGNIFNHTTFGQDSPITFENHLFRKPMNEIDLDIWLNLKPTNGNWDDTDTKYTHSVSPIIVIEKL